MFSTTIGKKEEKKDDSQLPDIHKQRDDIEKEKLQKELQSNYTQLTND